MKTIRFITVLTLLCCTLGIYAQEPVDYVNPYIGNISHMLQPTYPTIQLPNSLLRVYPNRKNFTSTQLKGLPVVVTGHRGGSAFMLSPYQGDIANAPDVVPMSYDNEKITPYYYSVDLDEADMQVEFAPSHQSAIYDIHIENSTKPSYVILGTRDGEMTAEGNAVYGYQNLRQGTKVYVYMQSMGTAHLKSQNGKTSVCYIEFPKGTNDMTLRYGISYISCEQAKKNLEREVAKHSVKEIAAQGRDIWNKTLGKVQISGATKEELEVFYTSLYRTYERMICISEDGQYWSGYDKKVHKDNGTPFYADDWIWDTYRAVHPLRLMLEPTMEGNMLASYIRMAKQQTPHWMPTFPGVAGNSNTMNCNHAVASMFDAWTKGVRSFDLKEAYQYCKAAITEKSLAPWCGRPAGVLDKFFWEHGYFPARAVGEKETVPEVDSWESRQPVAVTLGTAYDQWCLGNIANIIGNKKDGEYFLKRSLDYKTIFNEKTGFFHPRDSFGRFIEPFDYRYPTGIGARDSYDENTGYEYRWDVQHNIADLINMIGGKKKFIEQLDDMFATPIDTATWIFYNLYPDHTGNVGQFSMGNEPALHIPYLYNYAGEPWRTQKCIRNLLKEWFRNDLMGVPGDEDGGGMTSFVVFSMIGFYPVTPGLPMYVIGSPSFGDVKIKLENGNIFEVRCENYSPENKYIQSARLNGKVLTKSWFTHEELMNGGLLEFVMGKHPNKSWGTADDDVPPSFKMN